MTFKQSSRYNCQILVKLNIFFTDFKKMCSNIKFRENPSSRSRVTPCGKRDGQTDGTIDRPIDGPIDGSTDGQN